ncbi:NADPH oxidase organizer 1-like [Takifugu flavidus]|nr:NADPH oxidase organizer 1-like [Takifugu flavidus]
MPLESDVIGEWLRSVTGDQNPEHTMTGDQRFVISARVLGAVQRQTPKLKTFMISVSWSDQTEVIVYRSFQDFRKFHRLLKKKFPQLNPFRKNSRLIPKFRGEARKSSLPKKGSARLVKRMKFLESYCDKLLKCEMTVTRSSEVTQFFTPKDHDLQADFTKNSIVMLLSDDLPDGSGGGKVEANNITHPFVTQTYRCVDAFETKDTKNRPFKVAVDEKLDVLIKDPGGWWLVENESKCLAWFPAPYLELWEAAEDAEAEHQRGGVLYCAVKNYTTKKEDEVSVPIGSVVEVLRKSDDGWWLIRFQGKAGYIPSMYLQPYNNPRAGLYNLRKHHSSTLNLATSRGPEMSPMYSSDTENNPQLVSGELSSIMPSRLVKARSLDILSETWSSAHLDQDTSVHTRERSISRVSQFSSSSEFSSSSKEDHQSGSSSPDISLSLHHSSMDSESAGSLVSKDSEKSSSPPRVPPRPKTEEIMNRCTTMTRKAALATKTRLQIQRPESSHIR